MQSKTGIAADPARSVDRKSISWVASSGNCSQLHTGRISISGTVDNKQNVSITDAIVRPRSASAHLNSTLQPERFYNRNDFLATEVAPVIEIRLYAAPRAVSQRGRDECGQY